MRRPTGKPVSRAEAQRSVDAFKGVVKGVKNYGKNVAGGAKIVGSAIKRRVKKVGAKLADDLFGSPALDARQRQEGQRLNQEYTGDGREMLKKAMRKLDGRD